MKKRATMAGSQGAGVEEIGRIRRRSRIETHPRSSDESTRVPQPPLKRSKALVVGIANEHSIAYGCAKAFHELGADVALTYLNDKAKPYVEPLARDVNAPLF